MRMNKNNDERRNEFVEAAEKLFRKNGIVATTVSSIVKEVDVAKGLFYYYFDSKDDVIDAVIDKYSAMFKSTMSQQDDSGTYEEKLSRFIADLYDSFAGIQEILCPGEDKGDLALLKARSFKETQGKALERLRSLLEEGNSSGEFSIKNTWCLSHAVVGGMASLLESGEGSKGEIKQFMLDLIHKAGKE